VELGKRAAVVGCGKALTELTKITYAPGRPDLLACRECIERDGTSLFKLSGV